MLVWKLCSIMKYAINFECARFLQISRSHETSPMVCHELNFFSSTIGVPFRCVLPIASCNFHHFMRCDITIICILITSDVKRRQRKRIGRSKAEHCTNRCRRERGKRDRERAFAVAHFATLFRFMIWRANRIPEQVKLAAILICENTLIAVNFHLALIVRVIDET